MRPRAPKSSSGFTLIELMVVLVLMAIMSGVIVAEMRGTFEDALLRSTARQVMSACQMAGARAITRGEQHVLLLDAGKSRYSIERFPRRAEAGGQDGSGGEGALDPRITIEIRDPVRATDAEREPPGESSQQDRATIRFYPDGTAQEREIVLKDRAGVEMKLRVNPVTGRVRLMEEME